MFNKMQQMPWHPATASQAANPRRWRPWCLMMAGQGFMNLLDVSIVNIAIRDPARDLHATYAGRAVGPGPDNTLAYAWC